MAKYLEQNAGDIKEVQPVSSSAGAGDSGKMVELDGAGRIDSSMMPVGIGADTASIVSSEDLNAGDFVNIWDDTGTPKVRKADGSAAGKEAHGFVLAAVTAPAAATVYFEGTNDQLSTMTGGATQFLSATTPGDVTETAPSGSGHIVQKLGRAYSATALAFEATQPIELV